MNIYFSRAFVVGFGFKPKICFRKQNYFLY